MEDEPGRHTDTDFAFSRTTRALILALGGLELMLGTAAVYFTDNEFGTVALLAVGGSLVILAILGDRVIRLRTPKMMLEFIRTAEAVAERAEASGDDVTAADVRQLIPQVMSDAVGVPAYLARQTELVLRITEEILRLFPGVRTARAPIQVGASIVLEFPTGPRIGLAVRDLRGTIQWERRLRDVRNTALDLELTGQVLPFDARIVALCLPPHATWPWLKTRYGFDKLNKTLVIPWDPDRPGDGLAEVGEFAARLNPAS